MPINICQQCGKAHTIYHYQVGRTKYCSKKCFNIARNHRADNELFKTCPICEKVFRAKMRFNIYCSGKCSGIGTSHKRKTGINKNCLHCNKEFYVQNYFKDKKKYCSKECATNSKKKYEAHQVRHKSLRKFLKDQGLVKKCHDCGYDKHPEILGIHHEDGDKQNSHLNNLKVLCPNCHSIRHYCHVVNGGHTKKDPLSG